MPMPRKTAALLAVLALAGVALSAGIALAADTITALPDKDDYAADEYRGDRGEVFRYSAAGAGTGHDVTAFEKGPDGRPLFRSRTIMSGTTPVEGTQYLEPGSYRFFCSVHGKTMQSALRIEAKGRIAARPNIEVAIPRQSLDAVREAGKLRIRLEAKTLSRGVTVVARKGSRRLGSVARLNLRGGAERVVAIPLSGAGRNALKNAQSAFVTVTGTVPFGAPDTARRNLK